MIWATRSRPYFSWTWRITASRRSWQKSMSKSGIETRSGLRKRSKSSPKRNGSRSVMVSAQATTAPAPEPRPARNPLPLRPLDEVGDDEKVAGEAHLDDRLELELEAVAVGPDRRLAPR